ncbi:MAG: NifU family protein [Pseudonocardiales bacterium]
MSEADPARDPALAALEPLLDRMEQLLGETEDFDETVRDSVFELLDGVDALHRLAVTRLAVLIDDPAALAAADPAVAWLFQAYGIGVDDPAAASAVLDEVRPYIQGHGGEVEVLDVTQGVVRLRLAGACSGCSAAAVTLRDRVEEALRDGLPGFIAMEVAPDSGAAPHPPPTTTLLQISSRPA